MATVLKKLKKAITPKLGRHSSSSTATSHSRTAPSSGFFTTSSSFSRENNVPFLVPPLQQNNLGAHGFTDDEPLPSTTPAAQSSGPQKVTIKSHTETFAIPAADSRPRYPVLVSICAPPLQDPDGKARTPIDLVTVLDVSGSMSGEKLDLVKQAVKFVIENLGSSDRLSIVTFSTTARTELPLKKMSPEGREDAIRAVDSLRSEDTTNIAAGLKIGAQILKERSRKNPVASIILLSDGYDNCSSKMELLNRLPFMEEEIPVHTFGFGEDHDPNIMHAISDTSGGTFSYIESVSMIQDAFALCVGGLLSVVAQEARLTIRSASIGVKIVSIPSGRHVNNISEDGQQGFVHVGYMYAEELKQFLVYLLVPPSTSASDSKTSLLDVSCAYKDLASGHLIQVQGERVEISRPECCSPAELAVSLEVDRQRNRLLVAHAIGEAHRLAEMGNLVGAKASLAQTRSTILASPAAQSGDSLITLLEAQLTQVMHRMATMDLYTQTGRAYALSGMSSHSLQRAAATGDSMTSWSLTMSESEDSTTSSGVYETPNMTRMLRLSHNLGTNPAA